YQGAPLPCRTAGQPASRPYIDVVRLPRAYKEVETSIPPGRHARQLRTAPPYSSPFVSADNGQQKLECGSRYSEHSLELPSIDRQLGVKRQLKDSSRYDGGVSDNGDSSDQSTRLFWTGRLNEGAPGCL
ncbi:hypothetical protein Bbelb_441140, partial [Branchiostoma belcheri]